MAVDALLENVSRLVLFADLDRDELAKIIPLMEEASYNEGEWVVRRGQRNVGLYVIVDGEVGVSIADEELATLSQGSFFGEISALLGEAAVADILTRTPLLCLHVPVESVEGFLLDNPRIMYRMLQTEARRLQATDELRI